MKYIKILFIFCFFSSPAYPTAWIDSAKKSVSYLFAPGVMGSETHLANYCPFFIASTGEEVSCDIGIEAIRQPVTTPNLAEINLRPIGKDIPKTALLETILLGPLKLLGYMSTFLVHHFYGVTIKPSTDTDYSVKMYWIHPQKINLAQEEDLRIFDESYKKHIKTHTQKNKKNNIVLYGVSRGSATVFNYIAQYKPTHVCAAICEGIYDSIPNVKTAYENLGMTFLETFKIRLLSLTSYNPEGMAPIKNVNKIPRNFPILLVTSLNDKMVPSQCTINLYTQLRSTGHNNVHLLVLNHSSHPVYTCDDQDDRDLYEAVVHAFYKAYKLPHIPALADKGQEYFKKNSQPSIAAAQEYLTKEKKGSKKNPFNRKKIIRY